MDKPHLKNYLAIWKAFEKCVEDWTPPDSPILPALRKLDDSHKAIIIEEILTSAIEKGTLLASIEIKYRTDKR